ncbi:MAG TPA: nuclear transport factor 2 family protein [Acidimicrobiales bacterium]|nr:nuclear transport factor 2 family protein [Acidimicrobiales bacterium]
MSQGNNIELIRRFFDAAISDPERLDDICSPDFTLVEPDLFPSPFTSLAAYKGFLADSPFSEATVTIDQAEPVAESVSIRYTFRGTVDGQPVALVRKANVQCWNGRIQRYDGTAEE